MPLTLKLSFSSRYKFTPVKEDADVGLRFGIWVPPDISYTKYQVYRVRSGDIGRLDLVAHRVYGDVKYWWVLAWVNRIANPLEDMFVGMSLKVPSLVRVNHALQAKPKGR